MRFKTGWGALLISLCLLNGQGFALAQKDLSPVVGETKAASGSSAAVVKTYTIHHQDAERLIAGSDGTLTLPIIWQLTSVFKSRNITPVPKLFFDKKTSTLMITGSQEAIEIADKMIPILDQPLPQVTVETKLFALTRVASQTLGTIPSDTGRDGQTSITFSSSSHLSPDFNERLNALLTSQQARLLNIASQKTKHGIPVVFEYSSAFPAQGAGLDAATSPLTPFENAKLSVTPYVDTQKNSVTLKLGPDFAFKQPVYSCYFGTCPYKDYRKLESVLTISDGESAMISGIMGKRSFESLSKMPFLGEIPFLGKLFSSTEKGEESIELLFIITPHALRSEAP